MILNTITVGDLFCGMGGWGTGFMAHNHSTYKPFDFNWAVDKSERVLKTHRKNVHCESICEDILQLDPEVLSPVDVIVGSPPCPHFSSARQAQERDIDVGLELVNAFFDIVKKVKPIFWMMENVRTFKKYIPMIKNLPRDAKHFIMKGSEYGVPQNRERCIVTNLAHIPKNCSTNETLLNVITSLEKPGAGLKFILRDATISHMVFFPRASDGKMVDKHELHLVKKKNIGTLYTKKRLLKNAGRVSFPDTLTKPSRTIVAQPSTVGRETIVIEDPRFKPHVLRYLSIREQLIIQGFPPDYHLPDTSKSENQRMIGNAFPPPMARVLGYQLREEYDAFRRRDMQS